jgi:hypothetical protein
LLALAPPRKNRYYRPPIREVGLGASEAAEPPARDALNDAAAVTDWRFASLHILTKGDANDE